jgi:methylated-DNA-[protein]-cysteine S-methyltransferase
MGSSEQRYAVFETASGFCGIAWNGVGITRFRLPERSAEAAERDLRRRLPGAVAAAPPPEVAEVIAAAKRYFAGETVDFSNTALDLAGQDEFFRRIYDVVRRVAWGQTTTYGAVAKELGAGPEAARDVGQAMANNPVPLIIPCHRVLAAGGKLGGFSAPGGTGSKTRMLELEGVRVGPPPPAQQSFGW